MRKGIGDVGNTNVTRKRSRCFDAHVFAENPHGHWTYWMRQRIAEAGVNRSAESNPSGAAIPQANVYHTPLDAQRAPRGLNHARQRI